MSLVKREIEAINLLRPDLRHCTPTKKDLPRKLVSWQIWITSRIPCKLWPGLQPVRALWREAEFTERLPFNECSSFLCLGFGAHRTFSRSQAFTENCLRPTSKRLLQESFGQRVHARSRAATWMVPLKRAPGNVSINGFKSVSVDQVGRFQLFN